MEERDVEAGVEEPGGEMEHAVDVALRWAREHQHVSHHFDRRPRAPARHVQH
jgi:hypothetical protein